MPTCDQAHKDINVACTTAKNSNRLV